MVLISRHSLELNILRETCNELVGTSLPHGKYITRGCEALFVWKLSSLFCCPTSMHYFNPFLPGLSILDILRENYNDLVGTIVSLSTGFIDDIVKIRLFFSPKIAKNSSQHVVTQPVVMFFAI